MDTLPYFLMWMTNYEVVYSHPGLMIRCASSYIVTDVVRNTGKCGEGLHLRAKAGTWGWPINVAVSFLVSYFCLTLRTLI